MTDVKKLREKLGLTQGELADRLGVSQGLISQFETGKQEMSRRDKLAFEALEQKETKHG